MKNLHNSFESYGGIKLVWVWRISTQLKLFRYINHTQNKNLCIDAQYQNPPILFLIHPLYTNTLFNSKTYKPTLLPFFQIFSNPPFLKGPLHIMLRGYVW